MLNQSTIELQQKFTNYTKNGVYQEIEGVKKDKIHHYRRLVRNIIDGSLQGAYPITYKFLSEENWDNLVDEFFENHKSQEYQIWRFPYQLYIYLQNCDFAQKIGIPFLNDLILFEWMEMDVFSMENIDFPNNLNKEINLEKTLVINPHLSIEILEYPVHIKDFKNLEDKKGTYFIICWRKISNDNVFYMEINHLTAIIFDKISQNIPLKNIFLDLETELKIDTISNDFKELLPKLIESEIILGFN